MAKSFDEQVAASSQVSSVSRATDGSSGARAVARPTPPHFSGSGDVLDLHAALVRLNNDEQLLHDVIGIFQADAHKLVEQLTDSVANADGAH